MADIQPFPGVTYDPTRVAPADVLTQPYDKITAAMREQYLARSPHNLIRIELGKDEPGDTAAHNKYTRARDFYGQWRDTGILRRSPQPALYWLEQTFVPPVGPQQPLTRRGLIAAVRLHRWEEGVVLPHEHTLAKPKADRMSLLRTCRAQQGQIFMLHPEPIPAPRLGAPLYRLVDDYAVTNTVWEITDPAAIQAIQDALRSQTLYIADGHHRYETALAYRDEAQTAASRFVMATLVAMTDPGLVVLPTHRVVGGLTGFDRVAFRRQLTGQFIVDPYPSLETMHAALAGDRTAIGLYDGEQFALARPRAPQDLRPLFASKPPLWHQLDVAILHVAILEALLGIDDQRLRDEANVTYWREPELALAEVRAGRGALAFFLRPTPVAAVRAIADARSRMPQKSTDFYPKLLSGMVMYEVS